LAVLAKKCLSVASWKDIQRCFQIQKSSVTDQGYFECLLLLFKFYGSPARRGFFVRALTARPWNKFYVMRPQELQIYEALPESFSAWAPKKRGPIVLEMSLQKRVDSKDIEHQVNKSDVFCVICTNSGITALFIPKPEAKNQPAKSSEPARLQAY
jgi:hypothetical protein